MTKFWFYSFVGLTNTGQKVTGNGCIPDEGVGFDYQNIQVLIQKNNDLHNITIINFQEVTRETYLASYNRSAEKRLEEERHE